MIATGLTPVVGKVKKKESAYTINIDRSTIKAIGFTDQRPVIDITDDVFSDCKSVK